MIKIAIISKIDQKNRIYEFKAGQTIRTVEIESHVDLSTITKYYDLQVYAVKL
jgi:hypothetical protein